MSRRGAHRIRPVDFVVASLALWLVAWWIEHRMAGGLITADELPANQGHPVIVLRRFAADQELLDDPVKLGAALRTVDISGIATWPPVLRDIVTKGPIA